VALRRTNVLWLRPRAGPYSLGPRFLTKEFIRAARLTASTALLASVLATTGCATYYRITDPASGRMYYTDDFKRRGSAVMFRDA